MGTDLAFRMRYMHGRFEKPTLGLLQFVRLRGSAKGFDNYLSAEQCPPHFCRFLFFAGRTLTVWSKTSILLLNYYA